MMSAAPDVVNGTCAQEDELCRHVEGSLHPNIQLSATLLA
jgi:hypothetical protein